MTQDDASEVVSEATRRYVARWMPGGPGYRETQDLAQAGVQHERYLAMDAEKAERYEKARRRAEFPDTTWTGVWNDHDHVLELTPTDDLLRRILKEHSTVGSWSGCLSDIVPVLHSLKGSHGESLRSHPSLVTSKLVRRVAGDLAVNKNDPVAEWRNAPVIWAKNFRYWTITTSNITYPGVLVDVDRSDALEHVDSLVKAEVVPQYSWAIVHHSNGHAQFCWHVPSVRKDEHPNAWKLYSAVYKTMRWLVGGDGCFVGGRSQNPLWSHLGDRSFGREIIIPGGVYRAYLLFDLKDFLVEHGNWCPKEAMGPGRSSRDLDALKRKSKDTGDSADAGSTSDSASNNADSASDSASNSALSAFSAVISKGSTPSRGSVVANTVARKVRMARERGMDPQTLDRIWSDIDGTGLTALDPSVLAGVVVPKGHRNTIMFRVATWLAWHGADPASAETAIRLESPLPASEMRSIVRKVKRYHEAHYDTEKNVPSAEWQRLCRNAGRRGGLRKSNAQTRARRACLHRGTTLTAERAVRSDARIWAQSLKMGDVPRRRIALSMGLSASTVHRALRRVRDRVRDLIHQNARGLKTYPSGCRPRSSFSARMLGTPGVRSQDDVDGPMSNAIVHLATRSILKAIRAGDGDLIRRSIDVTVRDLMLAEMIDQHAADPGVERSFTSKINRTRTKGDVAYGRLPIPKGEELKAIEPVMHDLSTIDLRTIFKLTGVIPSSRGMKSSM